MSSSCTVIESDIRAHKSWAIVSELFVESAVLLYLLMHLFIIIKNYYVLHFD